MEGIELATPQAEPTPTRAGTAEPNGAGLGAREPDDVEMKDVGDEDEEAEPSGDPDAEGGAGSEGGADADADAADADADAAASADAADTDAKVSADADADAESSADGEDGDADADGEDADAEGEEEDGPRPARDQAELLEVIHTLSSYLCDLYDEDGQEIAAGFQRLPNKRNLPDYFDIITTPIAFSTIRNKILKKLYTTFSEFVRDVAQICHNAQVYNRSTAPIFGAAIRLREAFKEELAKLVASGEITAADGELPYLGELPSEESPSPEEDEEDEDDEDEDEDEDTEDDGTKRRPGKKRSRPSVTGVRQDGAKDEEAHKKRGRPPKVFTPMEARISAVLKGLRKFKDDDGDLLILPFEKLPDKTANPDYYTVIRNPIALDHIKRKAKRKKYPNVDAVLKDIETMFENAKRYNDDESDIFRSAVQLQHEARIIAQQEKAKPDDQFRDDDGKLPLSEISHLDQVWKVGDWVHIKNPNDLTKPVVAQLYRMWQDRTGQRWVNACWYYRPEQTVHRLEKHFYEHEVVKTGQYRDHEIESVMDRCFVMFVTRFPKGRPRGFPPDKDVYVCESRYNEEKATFNKIKTWASCVPDEVREKDYEMDLFELPRKMRKQPSPIKHLLRPGATPSDDLPKPTWGNPNAPPIVGAVHMRLREGNESPPPQRTPSPPPERPVSMLAELGQQPRRTGSLALQSPMSANGVPTVAYAATSTAPAQSPVPYPSQYASSGHINNSHAPQLQPQPQPQQPPPPQPQQLQLQPQPQSLTHVTSIMPAPHQATPHVPVPIRPTTHYIPPPIYAQSPAAVGYSTAPQPYVGQSPVPSPAHMAHGSHPTIYPIAAQPAPHATPDLSQQRATATISAAPPAASMRAPMVGTTHSLPNMYNPPKPAEVYVLSDGMNDEIPEEVRKLFHHDEAGRVLFFHNPPLSRPGNGAAAESAGLGHSIRYLADKKRAQMACRAAEGQSPPQQQLEQQQQDNGDTEGTARPHKKRYILRPSATTDSSGGVTNGTHSGRDGGDVSWDDVGKLAGETWSGFDQETAEWRRGSGIDEWDDMMTPIRVERERRAADEKQEARKRLQEKRRQMQEEKDRERLER